MAVAINSSLQIQVTSNNLVKTGTIQPESASVNSTSDVAAEVVNVVGTTEASIDTGAVADPCMLIIKNLSTTATVEVGRDISGTFTAVMGSMRPNDPAMVLPYVDPDLIELKASTASTNVRVTAIRIIAPA
jgi:hypothetical protein